jgi:hypothetical protein
VEEGKQHILNHSINEPYTDQRLVMEEVEEAVVDSEDQDLEGQVDSEVLGWEPSGE